MPRVESERTEPLSPVLQREGTKTICAFDFGDNWEHDILLEKWLPAEPHTTYPICTDGQLACPPENCGGIPGYYDLLDAVADSCHPRHEELRDWIDDEYNPETLSIDKVNRLHSPAHAATKAPPVNPYLNCAAMPK